MRVLTKDKQFDASFPELALPVGFEGTIDGIAEGLRLLLIRATGGELSCEEGGEVDRGAVGWGAFAP